MKRLTLYDKYKKNVLAEGGFMDFMGDDKKTDAVSQLALMGGQAITEGPSVGKGALTGLGTGLSVGKNFGPVGAAIGAGAGLLIGGITGGLRAKKLREEEENEKRAMTATLKGKKEVMDSNRSNAILAGNPSLMTGNLNSEYFAYGGTMMEDPTEPKLPTMKQYMDTPLGKSTYDKYSGPLILDKAGKEIKNFTRRDTLRTMAEYMKKNASNQSSEPSNVYRPEYEHYSIDNPLKTPVTYAADGGSLLGEDPPTKEERRAARQAARDASRAKAMDPNRNHVGGHENTGGIPLPFSIPGPNLEKRADRQQARDERRGVRADNRLNTEISAEDKIYYDPKNFFPNKIQYLKNNTWENNSYKTPHLAVNEDNDIFAPSSFAANGGSIKAPLSTLMMNGGSARSLSSSNTALVGASHANGGIDIPSIGAEVEGGETTNNDYVFSKKLGFAAMHRPIAKAKGKIEEKPATKERINSLRLLMGRENALKEQQEMVKQQLNLS